jgi:hypothetical protein
MDERMFFVIGSPRSGTTMLMRMLNVHNEIYSRPEPHLLTPLAHLGYYGYVDKAPYDQFQAAESTKEFVDALPGREKDYIEALRAYTDILYGRMLEPTSKQYFLDKTPANALILPFISTIYPKAKYVVLTRHPFAIFSSFAKSFFDNDWEAAQKFNPILERYIPAIARFIRKEEVSFYHVRYEKLVADPEKELQALCTTIGMAYDPAMVNYGEQSLDSKGLGDPIGVGKDKRPNTKSVNKWANEVANNEQRIQLLQDMLTRIDDDDLAVWGYTRESLWEPLQDVDTQTALAVQQQPKKWDRYHMKRRLLLVLRKGIHGNFMGRILGKVRFYCDVLLRE